LTDDFQCEFDGGVGFERAEALESDGALDDGV
jgi:hypothetical protein